MSMLPFLSVLILANSPATIHQDSQADKKAEAKRAASQKTAQFRKIEVKPAGISMMVPKSWKSYASEGSYVVSLKIPTSDPKVEGRYDIGFVNDDANDVDGFQKGVATTLATRGDTLVEQYVSDVMGGKFAFTKFIRDGRTTVRGVLFRPTKQKLVVVYSTPSSEFEGLFPLFQSTLETIKDSKVVEATPVTGPEPKNIRLSPKLRRVPLPTPIKIPAIISGRDYIVTLPQGAVASKLGESSFSVVVPKIPGSIVLSLSKYDNPSQATLEIVKVLGANAALFSGGVKRINDWDNYTDGFLKCLTYRNGLSAKDRTPIASYECFIASTSLESYVYCNYITSSMKDEKRVKSEVIAVMTSIRLELKK